MGLERDASRAREHRNRPHLRDRAIFRGACMRSNSATSGVSFLPATGTPVSRRVTRMADTTAQVMRVVVLHGLPGVGKLTIARGLARLRGYRVFHNHLVFDAVEALFPFGSPAFVELRDRLWFELLSRAVHEGGADIVFTIARDRTLDAGFLGGLIPALSHAGAAVCCIEITCRVADLEHRVASAGRSQFGKVHSVERFRQLQMAGAFPRFSTSPAAISVDTSGMTVDEAVAAVDSEVRRASCAV